MILKKGILILLLLDFVLATTGKKRKISHNRNIPISSENATGTTITSLTMPSLATISISTSASLPEEPCLPITDIELKNILNDFDDADLIVPEFIIDIPEDLKFPEDFFAVSSVSWDVEAESEWTLPLREYRQYLATAINASAASILDNLGEDLFDGRYAFDRLWPGTTQKSVPTKLFFGYQQFALKLLFSEGQNASFEKLCKLNLIDLNRPIYDNSTNLYHSFLSIATSDANVPIVNAELAIKYSSPVMLNWPSSDGILPLEAAVKRNQMILVRKLVESGADVNKITFENWPTPFMAAITLKNFEIIAYFLSFGKVNPNVMLQDGTNVLVLFARHLPEKFDKYFIEIVETLTIDSFSLIINNLYDSNNPLSSVLTAAVLKGSFHQFFPVIFFLARKAVERDDILLLSSLYDNGIPLKDLVFESGLKLIHIAALHGHVRTSRFLIGKGSFINSITNEMYTAIQIAYINRHLMLVSELIAMGASLGLLDVLQIAIINNDFEIFETLILHSNNLNHFNFTSGFNLITWCIAQDRPKILQLLFNSKKVDFNIADTNGKTIFNFELPESASLGLTLTVGYIIQSFPTAIKKAANKK